MKKSPRCIVQVGLRLVPSRDDPFLVYPILHEEWNTTPELALATIFPTLEAANKAVASLVVKTLHVSFAVLEEPQLPKLRSTSWSRILRDFLP